jgi:hypothetical protein
LVSAIVSTLVFCSFHCTKKFHERKFEVHHSSMSVKTLNRQIPKWEHLPPRKFASTGYSDVFEIGRDNQYVVTDFLLQPWVKWLF